MLKLFQQLLGDSSERTVKHLRETLVRQVNELEPEIAELSTEALRGKMDELRERARAGESLDDVMPETFALVREAAKRTLGQRHHDVQLIGGAVLFSGKIAEMKTGEGKTLVATLPLALNALEGRGGHLVTPNDYLSRVGAGWMGPIYHLLGISVGVITHEFAGIYDPAYRDPAPHGDERLVHFRPVHRREAYLADVTYGTNNEFGFDYLRDNMVIRREDLVQRELRYAIVDEVDFILIDEARTPLIISGQVEQSTELYYQFSRLLPRLAAEQDYHVDEKLKTATLTEEGVTKLERALGVDNLTDPQHIELMHHAQQALRAHTLYHRDVEYVVKDGQDHRRRVHGPADGWAAVQRRAAPGDRGEGRRQDRKGDADPRHDYVPELLPHVRQAGRDDRHGEDGGSRAHADLQPSGDGDPHAPADDPK